MADRIEHRAWSIEVIGYKLLGIEAESMEQGGSRFMIQGKQLLVISYLLMVKERRQ